MMPDRVSPVAQPVLSGLVTRSGLTRRRWLRMLARFTGGSLGLLFAIGLVIAYLITLRPDVPGSRRLAQRELQVLLEPDETVHAVAWARRREWWDGFRETYGILALTDRRALFVGIPPRELVSPERGPQQFVILQLGRDESLRIRRTRVDLGSAPGVSIETDRSRFAFASDDRVGLDSVLANVARNRRATATADQLARRVRDYEEIVTLKPVYHRVEAGDALSSIAARYGTTEAQLIALNRLTSTTIKVKQRLLVKRKG
ncbi:MAG: LysM peptidoglycan-binding domain-containing protein [Gemmatimonadaceae bacterium]|nr:LysM peptidoglycan-binding domain-containing protein [Gemmatimonadaceae bacterium]